MQTLDARSSLSRTLDATLRTGGVPADLRAMGLRLSDVRTLAGLADADGATVAGLAGRLLVPRRAVALALRRLEATGRIEREGDEAWLTDGGRALRTGLWSLCAGL